MSRWYAIGLDVYPDETGEATYWERLGTFAALIVDGRLSEEHAKEIIDRRMVAERCDGYTFAYCDRFSDLDRFGKRRLFRHQEHSIYETAKEAATGWHDGPSSALYKVSCRQLLNMDREDLLQGIEEVRLLLKEAYSYHPKEVRQLLTLKAVLKNRLLELNQHEREDFLQIAEETLSYIKEENLD